MEASTQKFIPTNDRLESARDGCARSPRSRARSWPPRVGIGDTEPVRHHLSADTGSRVVEGRGLIGTGYATPIDEEVAVIESGPKWRLGRGGRREPCRAAGGSVACGGGSAPVP
jgi:hypothetical protein